MTQKIERNFVLKMNEEEYETMLSALAWFERCEPFLDELTEYVHTLERCVKGETTPDDCLLGTGIPTPSMEAVEARVAVLNHYVARGEDPLYTPGQPSDNLFRRLRNTI